MGIEQPAPKTRLNASELPLLLTVADLAGFLRLTVKGVYSLVETRRIPFVRVSNRIRFLREDVLAWLQGNRVPASEE